MIIIYNLISFFFSNRKLTCVNSVCILSHSEVSKERILPFFNEVFDKMCQLAADPDKGMSRDVVFHCLEMLIFGFKFLLNDLFVFFIFVFIFVVLCLSFYSFFFVYFPTLCAKMPSFSFSFSFSLPIPSRCSCARCG
jgi:hypothetical protein